MFGSFAFLLQESGAYIERLDVDGEIHGHNPV